jgi:hypothetical protein
MSSDSDRSRPSFRFRDKFSHLKEKIKDKAIKHNITLFVHKNLTSDNDNQTSHRGFRERIHGLKDTVKNKTHYESIKDKIKTKIDYKFVLNDNSTYMFMGYCCIMYYTNNNCYFFTSKKKEINYKQYKYDIFSCISL